MATAEVVAETAEPRPSRPSRGMYKCSRCGLPKKDHVCPAPDRMSASERKRKFEVEQNAMGGANKAAKEAKALEWEAKREELEATRAMQMERTNHAQMANEAAWQAMQAELVATAEELGMLLIGPNGQGVVSTPESMCAQIVAPNPPAGRIGVASQSGNLVSSYLNYAVATGVGISKAVSLGNSAQTGLPELLEYFSVDPDTDVAVGYVEGVGDGRAFRRAAERLTRSKPLVLVKGGARAEGQRRSRKGPLSPGR